MNRKPPNTKWCSTCCTYRVYAKFDKNRSRKDGYSNQCKACKSSYFKSYYRANGRKPRVEYYQEYYQKNKDRKRIISRKASKVYYQRHRYKILFKKIEKRIPERLALIDSQVEVTAETQYLDWTKLAISSYD